jgi:hypothetical protein
MDWTAAETTLWLSISKAAGLGQLSDADIAVGACAWDGGLVRSNPNPTGALGLQDAVPGSRKSWCKQRCSK